MQALSAAPALPPQANRVWQERLEELPLSRRRGGAEHVSLVCAADEGLRHRKNVKDCAKAKERYEAARNSLLALGLDPDEMLAKILQFIGGDKVGAGASQSQEARFLTLSVDRLTLSLLPYGCIMARGYSSPLLTLPPRRTPDAAGLCREPGLGDPR
jgi:hypothetical protein